MNRQCGKCVVLFATCLCLVTGVIYGQQANKNSHSWSRLRQEKREFVFKGRVEKVNPKAKTVVVTNDMIAGWRFSMTETYRVDNPEVLMELMPGDRVTAKVYENEFKTLFDLQLVPPEDTPVFFPKKF